MEIVTEKQAFENLGNAIVLQAVADYRRAKKKLQKARRRREKVEQQAIIDECLQFFRSRWFGVLTDLDGEDLIKRLDKETT